MIIPTALLTQESYLVLRTLICAKYHIHSIVRLPNESFGARAGDVKVDTIIIVIGPKKKKDQFVNIIGYAGYERINEISEDNAHLTGSINQKQWNSAEDCIWTINTTEEEQDILDKCQVSTIPLIDCVDFCLGLTPYDKYKGHTQDQIKQKVFHCDHKKNDTFKKLLAGNDVTRYDVVWNGEQWISYGKWLGAPREQRFFTDKRILVKQIIDWTSKRIWATLTDEELYNTQNAFNLIAKQDWDLEYLLAILNSKLMSFFHRKKYLDEFKMRFQKILIKDCKQLPIKKLKLNSKSNQKDYEKLIDSVNHMLKLQRKLRKSKTPHESANLAKQSEILDSQIDGLVYSLYGLSENEIQIVEKCISPL